MGFTKLFVLLLMFFLGGYFRPVNSGSLSCGFGVVYSVRCSWRLCMVCQGAYIYIFFFSLVSLS